MLGACNKETSIVMDSYVRSMGIRAHPQCRSTYALRGHQKVKENSPQRIANTYLSGHVDKTGTGNAEKQFYKTSRYTVFKIIMVDRLCSQFRDKIKKNT